MKFIDRKPDSIANLVGVCNRRERTLQGTTQQKRGVVHSLFLVFYRKIYFLVCNQEIANLAVHSEDGTCNGADVVIKHGPYCGQYVTDGVIMAHPVILLQTPSFALRDTLLIGGVGAQQEVPQTSARSNRHRLVLPWKSGRPQPDPNAHE